MLDRYPEQYQFGQRNAFVSGTQLGTLDAPLTTVRYVQFNVRIFWQWIGNALYHSIVIYIATAILFYDELILPQGWIAGQWVWGTTVYVATLATVLLKAALISE